MDGKDGGKDEWEYFFPIKLLLTPSVIHWHIRGKEMDVSRVKMEQGWEDWAKRNFSVLLFLLALQAW